MLGKLVQVHLILFSGHPVALTTTTIAEACIDRASDELRLRRLVFLLQLILKLLQTLQSLVHVHVLGCSILRLVEAAEILLRVTEVLQVVLRLLLSCLMVLLR